MRLDGALLLTIAELARRRPAFRSSLLDQSADAAAELRSIYYPKQRAYFTSAKRFRATRKTRRAGATTGGCREFIARAITHPGWRGVYVASTRVEARARAWMSDTKSGFVDVLRQYGTPVKHPTLEVVVIGGVRATIRESVMEIDFDNGSKIELFGADDERSLRKLRGQAKHVYWIDEAQDFRWLDAFINKVVTAGLGDYNGECWMTGTPGQDCSGMFYDVTKGDHGPDDKPIDGWDVHTIAQVDNPFFGHVVALEDGKYTVEDNLGKRDGLYSTIEVAEEFAKKVRWDRATAPARDRGLKETDPDFIREFLGLWVREDMRYVYPVLARPEHELVYAPQRLVANPFKGSHDRFDHHPQWCDWKRAISDLPKMPKYNKRRQWMFALGVDFGFHPDPFALVAWAFATDTDHVYELFSWKCTKVHTDDQGAYMKLMWDALDNVVVFAADPAGKQDDFEMWRMRLGLPIDEANKKGKEALEEFLADDIRRGRIHLRRDSPLHLEMKHLIYLPTKPGKSRQVNKHRRASDGIVHGDHCCDGGRYSYASLTHYLSRTPETEPKPGSPAALVKEEEKVERSIERREETRAEALLRGDEEAIEHGVYGYD